MIPAALTTGIALDADAAFERVVRERQAQVLRTAYRMLGNWADAEDVAQEVFVRLYRHGLDFSSDALLGGWVYRVTVNLCLDRARSARPAEELVSGGTVDATAEARLLYEERKQRLMRALSMLPAKERAALVLREIEGLETAEVAAILGSSEGTVRSQVSRAMDRLREILTREAR